MRDFFFFSFELDVQVIAEMQRIREEGSRDRRGGSVRPAVALQPQCGHPQEKLKPLLIINNL